MHRTNISDRVFNFLVPVKRRTEKVAQYQVFACEEGKPINGLYRAVRKKDIAYLGLDEAYPYVRIDFY